VRDSDGTVVFSIGPNLAGGSQKTVEFAGKQNKPLLHLHRGCGDAANALRYFVADHDIAILNIAGPRESEEPEVGEFVKSVLTEAFPSS
jgi:hypothetical protein